MVCDPLDYSVHSDVSRGILKELERVQHYYINEVEKRIYIPISYKKKNKLCNKISRLI